MPFLQQLSMDKVTRFIEDNMALQIRIMARNKIPRKGIIKHNKCHREIKDNLQIEIVTEGPHSRMKEDPERIEEVINQLKELHNQSYGNHSS
jgi:hypothetical protein